MEALNTFSHLSYAVYMGGKCLRLPHKYLFFKQKEEFSGKVLEISEIAETTESGQLQNFNNNKVWNISLECCQYSYLLFHIYKFIGEASDWPSSKKIFALGSVDYSQGFI